MNIQITDSEMMEEIECGSDTWEVVEEGEWTQNYKHRHKESVVKHIPTGKFYQYEVSRAGSPFTDWCYSYEYGDYPELCEVTQEERTIVQQYWKRGLEEKVMSPYYVQVNADFCKGYSVEADSEEEAMEIAKENFEYDYSNDWDSLDMKAEEI